MFFQYCASTVRCSRELITFSRHLVVISNTENSDPVSEWRKSEKITVTLKKRQVFAVLRMVNV
jgi:hypothetical protein